MKRRIIALFVIFIILCYVLTVSFFGCGEKNITERDGEKEREKEYTIAVISDLHVIAPEEITDITTEDYDKYAYNRQRLYPLDSAILASTVEKLIEQKPNVVLVCGDLTEGGSVASINYVVKQLNRLENNGIQVFVTAGIEDYSGLAYSFTDKGSRRVSAITPKDFVTRMGRFGYNQALTKATETNSYVADINDKYRLLVIDTAYGYTNKDDDGLIIAEKYLPEISDYLISYIEESLQQAQRDGKEMLVMSYFAINKSPGTMVNLGNREVLIKIDRQEEIENLLVKYGVKTIFSGHLHTQKQLVYTDEEGNSSTDYHIGALCNYPVPITYMTDYKDEGAETGLFFSTSYLDKLDGNFISENVDEEVIRQVTTDLLTYSKNFVFAHIRAKLQHDFDNRGITNQYFKELLKKADLIPSYKVVDEKTEIFTADIRKLIEDFLDMRIYGEGDTIESVCLEYGIELPQLPYTTVFDMICNILCDVYADTVNIHGGDDMAIVARYIVYVGCRKLADFDIIGKLREYDSTILDCDLHDAVDYLFETDILDVTINDFILSIVSIINIPIHKKIGITLQFKTSKEALSALNTIFKALPLLLEDDQYDAENDTIWGISYRDYINLKEGTACIQDFFDDVLIEMVAQTLVS